VVYERDPSGGDIVTEWDHERSEGRMKKEEGGKTESAQGFQFFILPSPFFLPPPVFPIPPPPGI
jgi:hypothetical protein